jgi:formylglycine-generating enzyme required for sulfatase activity
MGDGGLEKAEYGYPYKLNDAREDLEAPDDVARVLRGGAFYNSRGGVRCAVRLLESPHLFRWYFGFRVVVRAGR